LTLCYSPFRGMPDPRRSDTISDWRRDLAWLLENRWPGRGGLTQAAEELGVSRNCIWLWRVEEREPNWENRKQLAALVRQTKREIVQ